MPTNDFLPIAIAGGAPVLDQPSYAALTPANGRGAGILPKEFYNKVSRQSSVMAAAIGLFLNNQGQNALDNGDIPGLAAAFTAALGGANAQAFFSLRVQDAVAAGATRNVSLVAGTYQVALQSFYVIDDSGGSNFNLTATQSGIVANGGTTVTVNTAAQAFRLGGAGYGRSNYANDMKVGTLVVPTAAVYTMTMTAAVTGGSTYTSKGSILTCERVA